MLGPWARLQLLHPLSYLHHPWQPAKLLAVPYSRAVEPSLNSRLPTLRMKILHCVATLDPSSGGPARSVPQLAMALADQGVEVGLWSPQSIPTCLPDLPPDASHRIRILSGGFREAVEEFGKPQLVHDHGIWLSCHREVARVCRSLQIPRIVSPRGMLEPWALNHKKWKKRLAWWLYQKRDLEAAVALHATAESEASGLRRLGLQRPIIVAANGVDLFRSTDTR